MSQFLHILFYYIGPNLATNFISKKLPFSAYELRQLKFKEFYELGVFIAIAAKA